MKRKIYIVSPREPSGATWLINCFLELGIKTYRVHETQMWQKIADEYVLTERENMLKKWLPTLSAKKSFTFIDNIEVVWTHEWPQQKFENHKIIYFVRDPRDSLLSRYKREAPNCTYEEFLNFPDQNTLLNKIDHWCLFNLVWLEQNDLKVFKFEDYRQSPLLVLKEILDWISFSASEEHILQSLEASTSEKAAEAEKKYFLEANEEEEIVNQGGIVGRWQQSGEEIIDASKRILTICNPILHKLGYSTDIVEPDSTKRLIERSAFITNNLPFFDYIKHHCDVLDSEKESYDYCSSVYKTLMELNDRKIQTMKLRSYEYSQMLINLQIIFLKIEKQTANQIHNLTVNQHQAFVLFKLTKKLSFFKKISPKNLIKSVLRKILKLAVRK